jgi:hypothetical protein
MPGTPRRCRDGRQTCWNASGCRSSTPFGLLNNSFRAAEEIRVLRSYMRQRENLVTAAGTAIQHMQKALTEMNIQLANVISGTTGMKILRDIGQRRARSAEARDA